MTAPRGSLCISIDVERGWGIWDRPDLRYFERCLDLEDSIVARLIDLFQRLSISATWAIVGQLLEPTATPPVKFDSRIWYAPHLPDELCAVVPKQDIGTHSFGHIYFGGVDRDEARQDIARARALHDRLNLPFESFVYPRNIVAHTDVLAEYGMRTYRSVDAGWHWWVREHVHPAAGRAANLLDRFLPTTPATIRPIRHHGGLVELGTSMLLMGRNGLRGLAPPRLIVSKAVRGLRRAAREGSVFHLWFHPSNFYYETDTQFAILGSILQAAVELRNRGDLNIFPMSSFSGL